MGSSLTFSFNPESEIEVELIDRCIVGEYVVSVTQTNGFEFDAVLTGRVDGFVAIVGRIFKQENPNPYGPVFQVATDDITNIYVH